jgi:hypothetical protein
MNTRIKLPDLVEAYEWASVTGPFENAAYVELASGRIWRVSDFDDMGEDPPEDIGDESLYLPVPGKAELDLGRSLALRFAAEHLPARHGEVRAFFSAPGAYGRFKRLLDESDQVEAWYAYEARGVEEALREWAVDHGVEVVSPGDP